MDKWTAKISSEFICLQWVCTNIFGAIYGTFCECAVQLMLITFSKVVKVNFQCYLSYELLFLVTPTHFGGEFMSRSTVESSCMFIGCTGS